MDRSMSRSFALRGLACGGSVARRKPMPSQSLAAQQFGRARVHPPPDLASAGLDHDHDGR
jgi:hypothetical protein